MEQKIVFRTIIEVLGKPKEHVETALKSYIEKLKTNKQYTLLSEEFAEVKKEDEQELWLTFAELEVETNEIQDLIAFCFDYMPSSIEIIRPKDFQFKDNDVSQFLNDLQAKLHHVDMVVKQVKMQHDQAKKNLGALLKNYITVLLRKGNLTGQQLSNLTGISKDTMEDFLDQLIDEGKIDLDNDTYHIKKEELKSSNG